MYLFGGVGDGKRVSVGRRSNKSTGTSQSQYVVIEFSRELGTRSYNYKAQAAHSAVDKVKCS